MSDPLLLVEPTATGASMFEAMNFRLIEDLGRYAFDVIERVLETELTGDELVDWIQRRVDDDGAIRVSDTDAITKALDGDIPRTIHDMMSLVVRPRLSHDMSPDGVEASVFPDEELGAHPSIAWLRILIVKRDGRELTIQLRVVHFNGTTELADIIHSGAIVNADGDFASESDPSNLVEGTRRVKVAAARARARVILLCTPNSTLNRL